MDLLKQFDDLLKNTTAEEKHETGNMDFSIPIPEGKTLFKPTAVGQWTSSKGGYVIKKNADGKWIDENDKLIENGAPVRIYDENLEYQSLQIEFTVADGSFKGRKAWHYIDTIHDNIGKVKDLINELGISAVSTLTINDIKDVEIYFNVKHGKEKTRERTKVDKETGVETVEIVNTTPIYLNRPQRKTNKPKTAIVEEPVGAELDLDIEVDF